MSLDRRALLGGVGVLACGGALLGGRALWAASASRPDAPFKLSDAAWRKRLTAMQYAVLREGATERPFSSPLDKEHGKGIFHCAGCNWPLYSSATKFDSGTGWPSFWKPLPKAIGTQSDYAIGVPRTEVHCANCGGHLGHVFKDGPPPTGLRYCMDGVALHFVAA